MDKNIVELQDPFRPALNPNFYKLTEPTSIRELLKKQGVIDEKGTRNSAFVVSVDGDYKLEKDWDQLVGTDNLVVLVALPPHLKGGGGGSNPLRLVLMVAVMVAAIYVPPLAGFGAFGTAAMQAGIMIGGSLLVNALLPVPQLGGGFSNDGAQAKQVNFLGPQSNQAKAGAPIATLYGRRRIYLDLAAQPYNEMSGDGVYLYQLFIVTQGEADIEELYIENTPFDNYDDIEYKVYGPNEKVDLFPDNVYTAPEVQGLKLEGSENGNEHIIGYRERTTSKAINDKKGRPPSSDYWEPTYEKTTVYSELTANIQFKGGFIATPLGAQTDTIGIDIYLPRGLAYMDDNGNPTTRSVGFIAQARLVDDSNQPAGDWFNLTKETREIPKNNTSIIYRPFRSATKDFFNTGIWIHAGTIDAIPLSYTFKVPKGRYEVRVGRATAANNSTRISDEIQWVGLRSYMPNKHYYGNVTMLAVKIRSSNNLNNNIARRVNVIATRILPVFNGTEWVKQPTRSIAWAAADILRNKEYGRGLKDSRINLKELERLDRIWYGRSDFFDGYFTEQLTVWEALTRVLEVGRAKPIYVAGIIDFVRNEPRIAPTQMFTPENIVKDSYQTQYVFPKTGEADHIIVEYTDPVSWKSADMICALPDSKMLKPMRIAMHSITSPQQAWREGIHRAAMHRVQREFLSWSTELEGMAVSYGNEVLVSYDNPEWGSTGRIQHFSGNVIHTSEELEWSGNNVICLRARDGSVLGTYAIERRSATSGIIPDLPLDERGQPNLSDGSWCEPTHYIFGNTERIGRKLVITGVVPGSNNQVSLSGVIYDDYPHNAENELEMPIIVPPHDDIEEVLAVTWIRVKKSIQRNIFEVSCNQARGALEYEFEVRVGVAAEWEALYKGETPLFTSKLPFGGQVFIRARVIGTHAGEWFVWVGEVTADESAISKTRPGLRVDKRGNNPVYADITIMGIDLDTAISYFIEQDGIVIWTGTLLKGQEATITRQFESEVIIDPEEIPKEKQVEFKAYAIDSFGDRSESAINYMIY
ncbi:host specificity factor TipJ family phage tail protein [Ignatzschineria cameli]|uniref:Tip attachment protein J HDII-ins2 domain-containing protein n=1 Tax=Ignatzschineria cameli TaxID=2182793 RepID=A0A2U2AQ82_9GAMM|nr:host specificity factor TipJ family phage tail protein [Ignatzschineria cameli]PWD85795.1 hypothetical protein DC077_07105 [Ignatzschineria cameli]PWD89423.1 hypothetical protein DC079_06730 [Ignatzschineria cameli]PWD90895.1 hypothetical protein DC081_06440 [Ignatzschineria cameli]PWD91683.1 hypothetical protein DC078_06725 [Ignatzschineria cameli]